ncbi:hypothetical protein SDJN02_15497, partial [Cucurbita argyrosperma subsp. argyrosperma]
MGGPGHILINFEAQESCGTSWHFRLLVISSSFSLTTLAQLSVLANFGTHQKQRRFCFRS